LRQDPTRDRSGTPHGTSVPRRRPVRRSRGDLTEAILEQGTAARLLATSREPLGVAGEHVFVVPSLDVETEALDLFEARAKAARSDFDVDEDNHRAVSQICGRLDGIPLAIELAAARISHLSPAQILERLDDRFRLLTGGQRRIQRQHPLRRSRLELRTPRPA
jgi:predicted ATPase